VAAATRGSPTLAGRASQTVPRSRGQSHNPAWRPRESSSRGQTRTGLSLPSAPAADPFSFPLGAERPPQSQWQASLRDWHPQQPIGMFSGFAGTKSVNGKGPPREVP
jgi:hypothetical protein